MVQPSLSLLRSTSRAFGPTPLVSVEVTLLRSGLHTFFSWCPQPTTFSELLGYSGLACLVGLNLSVVLLVGVIEQSYSLMKLCTLQSLLWECLTAGGCLSVTSTPASIVTRLVRELTWSFFFDGDMGSIMRMVKRCHTAQSKTELNCVTRALRSFV